VNILTVQPYNTTSIQCDLPVQLGQCQERQRSRSVVVCREEAVAAEAGQWQKAAVAGWTTAGHWEVKSSNSAESETLTGMLRVDAVNWTWLQTHWDVSHRDSLTLMTTALEQVTATEVNDSGHELEPRPDDKLSCTTAVTYNATAPPHTGWLVCGLTAF